MRRRNKVTRIIFWIISVMVAISMLLSLIVTFFPGQ